ncbi:hypothetical protein AAF712_010582 [Marasmius tenuissimus]|uniref:Uncharacterized protein n=1 Tax=Marasmius tenuissimus TaxID=585030 RepID=A0ABR2ZMC1_9AGAR
MAALSYQGSFFLAVWIEAIVFGLYFCLFGIDLILTFASRGREGERRYLKSVFWFTNVMFFIATLHVILAGYRFMKWGVPTKPFSDNIPFASEGGPFAVPEGITFVLAGSWENLTYSTLYPISEILGSAAAIYRCWVLRNKSWKIITIPLFLLLAEIVSVITGLLTRASLDSPLNPTLGYLTISFYVVTLFLNITATALMILPLWSGYRQQMLPGRSSILRPVFWILLESAALQVLLELVILGLFMARHPALNIMVSILPPSVGIIFSLITVRIKLAYLGRDTNMTGVDLPTMSQPTFTTMNTLSQDHSPTDTIPSPNFPAPSEAFALGQLKYTASAHGP